MAANPTFRLLTVVLASLASLGVESLAVAQRIVPGYVVLTSGESLQGAIRLSSPIEQQLEVRFIPLAANQVLKLPVTKVRAYGYVIGEDTVRYVACPVQLGYPVVFRSRVAGQSSASLKQLRMTLFGCC